MYIRFITLLISVITISQIGYAQTGTSSEIDTIISDAYWELWNPDVQEQIDNDIERYRKADAYLVIPNLPAGAEVKVEQLSHDFLFGAQIFNFNQLGSTERNERYKSLFGDLFNSATIPFYWKTFEMEPNRPRFKEEYWDTEKFWNQIECPQSMPHWRRPATDPLVEFGEKKGLNLLGHPIAWGIRDFQHPEWLLESFAPEDEKETLRELSTEELYEKSPDEIAELIPNFTNEMHRLFIERAIQLAEYYGDRIHMWDVVNESSFDFHGDSRTGELIQKSHYGLMPGDYAYNSFRLADRYFPDSVIFNINDYANDRNYVNQVHDLLAKGARIDNIGSQMHLFDPQQTLDIAAGEPIESPDVVRERMELLSETGLPIHLSEITIAAPGDDERGREIQAVVARNLYRLWFSIENMMGITWWNLVDNAAVAWEPSTSGLFTRDMQPKPSYFAVNQLINNEWKTNKTLKAENGNTIEFRGFKGKYMVTWKDENGSKKQAEFYLKENGDGFRAL